MLALLLQTNIEQPLTSPRATQIQYIKQEPMYNPITSAVKIGYAWRNHILMVILLGLLLYLEAAAVWPKLISLLSI